ncbi:MAG TPA: FAD-dependent oxidoreductase [Rhodocyclaceae bacterium]|nr:FAD-dependent oxidoreductase [Rhodocyclaceae bacterium]
MTAPVVIIGSGLAGITVARELRKLDTTVPLTIITSDDGAFYSKPSLSNAIAAGKTALQLALNPAAKLAEQLNADFLTNEQVSHIDTAAKTISSSSGVIEYSQLVLANGAHPIRLPLTGSGAEDVLSVNNLGQYAVFRERLQAGMSVAILGAGLIGCEFANDLRHAGHAVSVFDLAPQPLGRLLPPQVGAYFRKALEAAGVHFHFGTSIANVDKAATGYALTTADGQQFNADIVLSAIGLKPATELAAAAGLKINRGVVVDRHLQTSAPDVYALGDCAEVEGLVLPFVLPIMSAARALAKTLAGEPTLLSYPAMPVAVKTPACPTIVSPPAMGAAGAWEEELIENGARALFKSPDGKLLGCALLGEASKERQTYAAQLPPVL